VYSPESQLEAVNVNLETLGFPRIRKFEFRYMSHPNTLVTACMLWPKHSSAFFGYDLIGLGHSRKSYKDQLNRPLGKRIAFTRAVADYIEQFKKIEEAKKLLVTDRRLEIPALA
jgi:hypothetical protein